MKATIISPEETLFEGDIHLIQVPGTKGSFEVLENHAPIVSTLDKGQIRVITKDGQELNFDIESGFIEVNDNTVNVLVM